MVLKGWLMWNAGDEGNGKTMMTAIFGKKQAKKWNKSYWSYDGHCLKQSTSEAGRVIGTYAVGENVARISSKQIDVEVIDQGQRGKISLKAQSAGELKPWIDAFLKKKFAEASPKKPAQPSKAAVEPPPFEEPKTKKLGALETLSALRTSYDEFELQVRRVEEAVQRGTDDEKLAAKADIAQINGRLDKLQFVGVDSVITSDLDDDDLKLVAKTKRKALNADIEELRRRIAAAFAALTQATDPSSPAGKD